MVTTSPSARRTRLSVLLRRFLRVPVPPSGTKAADAWLKQARGLGRDAAPLLLRTLEMGTEAEQYAALLALRQQGYEAWADGYDEDLVYRITRNGKTVVIKPEIVAPVSYE